jgi:peroxiredoxin (alkyl hydroperoxide reductase subunit C)
MGDTPMFVLGSFIQRGLKTTNCPLTGTEARRSFEMENNTTNMPLLGDAFPEMKVNTTHGPMNIPGDLKGSWFVLFSHPADFTPVCTTEFVAFQKRVEQFDELNTKLIGMSIDQVFSHIKWVEWIKDNLNVEITFPIVAANDAIAMKLGMLHPGKGTNTVRAVFVGDPEGKVRLVLYYPQEIGRNMDEVVRAVKALKLSDENKVAMPAGWPDNELIKDRVIIPPANNVADALKRKESCEGYDWWFCHKNLE